MQHHAQVFVLLSLDEAPLDFVVYFAPLFLVGGVDVEKPGFPAERLDLVLDAFDIAYGGAPIQVDADDVAAGARQMAAHRFVETAGSSENQSPSCEGRNRYRRRSHHACARTLALLRASWFDQVLG